jgi:CheY-like chemotaxis protein
MNAKKILIVDDQKFVRQMIRDILAHYLFIIEEAGDGDTAVTKAQEFVPDIILMDLLMPGVDGVEACRRIKQDSRTAAIPVILLTTTKDKDHLVAAFAAGADDYITKPYSDKELLARIRANLFKRDATALLETKTRDTEKVVDISQAIFSSLNSQEILQIIVKKIAEYIAVKRCSIVQIEEKGYGFVLASSDNPVAKKIRIELKRYPEVEEVIRTGKALIVKDAKHHPLLDDVKEYIADLDFDTILVIPICYQKEVISTLMLRTTAGSKSFNSRELRFCQMVADASAKALHNASLHEKVLDKSEELRLPLASLQRHCRLIKEEGTDSFSTTQREHLDSALENCERLAGIIGELLHS